jgi:sec-independent protein translocase protein TatA
MLGMITPTVAVILLVLALIIFGPGKLPQLGKSLGQGIKEFKDATNVEENKDQEKKES